MYLSDRDLAWAIETGRLIVDPRPEKIDATSLDLHLGNIEDAKIWDVDQFRKDEESMARLACIAATSPRNDNGDRRRPADFAAV